MTIHDFPLLSKVRVKGTHDTRYVIGYDRDPDGRLQIQVSHTAYNWNTFKNESVRNYYKPEELETI